jgi:hypothetical protein
LAGCVLAFLLGGWMLAVPVVLIDRLKDSPGPGAGTVSVIIVACALVTASLAGHLFFSPKNERTSRRFALLAAVVASVVAGAASALRPEYGPALLIPALVAAVPALILLTRHPRRIK